jgi:hypothetical protein
MLNSMKRVYEHLYQATKGDYDAIKADAAAAESYRLTGDMTLKRLVEAYEAALMPLHEYCDKKRGDDAN